MWPHSFAACMWHLYSSRFNCSFLLYKNFISSFIHTVCIFLAVLCGSRCGVWDVYLPVFRNHLFNKTLLVEIDVGTALCKFGSQVLVSIDG